MDLNRQLLFNVVLFSTTDFSYLDQGVLKLNWTKGLANLELELSDGWSLKCYAIKTALDHSNVLALCSMATGQRAEKLRIQALIGELDQSFCLQGMGIIKVPNHEKQLQEFSCFMSGYSIQ